MVSQQILAVVHQATSEAGLIGDLLQQRGYGIDQCCPALGQPLPQDLSAYSGVVVFGGPMSANDDHLDFIRQELTWIEQQVMTSATPFLGICLGAQLLARVLGAAVRFHPDQLREVGYFPLTPTAAGQPWFPQPMQVYHWHQEGFDLPPDSQLLAQGDWFPNQAFLQGGHRYGFQFHPEITQTLIEQWTVRGAEMLCAPGAQPRQVHLSSHQQHGPIVAAWLDRFLAHWLEAASLS